MPDDPPHPDDYRNEDQTTNYDEWRRALAGWREQQKPPPSPDEGDEGGSA